LRLIKRLFKRLLLVGTPSPATAKIERFQIDVPFSRVGKQQGMQLKGEIIPIWRPTTSLIV